MITRGEMPQPRRACVPAGGGATAYRELPAPGRWAHSLAGTAAFLLLAAGCALRVRRDLLARLRRSQEAAEAARRSLLRPLPPRIDGLALAGAHLSATRGAAIGGDLYGAAPTPHGVRVVIGDVRGHGLPSAAAAAVVLGAFRDAAYDEPSLAGVLRRMERALARHVRDRAAAEHTAGAGAAGPAAEEFVTVLLLQIAEDGTLTALNCGHPWPHVLRARAAPRPRAALPPAAPARTAEAPAPKPPLPVPAPAGPWPDVRAVDGGDPLPPLGVVPVPDGLEAGDCGRLGPGDVLFLHTDGAEDARDAAGRFFPLPRVLSGIAARQPAATPARLVAGVHAALLRHTGGHPADDAALLAVRSDRCA
ncbi:MULTISPECIES: PP2C family protein-serine/threonine phosphatase [Streptomyces]